jgi:hypothetical protein
MMAVEDALSRLPVTRLIHFTPAVNLDGIFADGAIRDSGDLSRNSAVTTPPMRCDSIIDGGMYAALSSIRTPTIRLMQAKSQSS